jgi:hypothetical protein
MAEAKTKEGVLTPADLAAYGIPTEQQPSHDPNSEDSEEAVKEVGKGQQWGGVTEEAVGE